MSNRVWGSTTLSTRSVDLRTEIMPIREETGVVALAVPGEVDTCFTGKRSLLLVYRPALEGNVGQCWGKADEMAILVVVKGSML